MTAAHLDRSAGEPCYRSARSLSGQGIGRHGRGLNHGPAPLSLCLKHRDGTEPQDPAPRGRQDVAPASPVRALAGWVAGLALAWYEQQERTSTLLLLGGTRSVALCSAGPPPCGA